MNNMYGEKKSTFIFSVLLGVGVGFGVLFLLVLLTSAVLSAIELGAGIINILAVIILGVSSFVSGFVSAKKNNSKLLIVGFFAGLVFYLFVAVVSAAITKNSFTSIFLLRLIVCVVSSIAGSILTTVSHRKQKYI